MKPAEMRASVSTHESERPSVERGRGSVVEMPPGKPVIEAKSEARTTLASEGNEADVRAAKDAPVPSQRTFVPTGGAEGSPPRDDS